MAMVEAVEAVKAVEAVELVPGTAAVETVEVVADERGRVAERVTAAVRAARRRLRGTRCTPSSLAL